jgi:hypothetical protein
MGDISINAVLNAPTITQRDGDVKTINWTVNATTIQNPNSGSGTAGAILTSNGPGSSVSWEKPILFAIEKTTPWTGPNSVDIINWKASDSSFINIGGGDWNDASGVYTVKSPGYYDITVQAQFAAHSVFPPNTIANYIAIHVNSIVVSWSNNFMIDVVAGNSSASIEYSSTTISKLIKLIPDNKVAVQCSLNNGTQVHHCHLKIIRVAI